MTPPRYTYRADLFGLSKETLNLNQAEAAAPGQPSAVADPSTSSLRLRHRLALVLAASVCALAPAVAPAVASAAVAAVPAWQIESVAGPTNFAPSDASGQDAYIITATNSGSKPMVEGEEVEITDTLPAGVTVTEVEYFTQVTNEGFPANVAGAGLCTTVPLRCTYPGPYGSFFKPLQPGQKLKMVVHVATGASEGPVRNEVEVAGGGAQSVSSTSQNEITSQPVAFGLHQTTHVTNLDGTPYTQAGGRPYELTTTVNLNTEFAPEAGFTPAEHFAPPEETKDIEVNFPAGLIANPQAVPLCSQADFGLSHCPVVSQVGTISFGSAFAVNGVTGLYDLEPAPGYAAEFGYHPPGSGIGAVFTSGVRTGGDYGQRTLSTNLPTVGLRYVSFTLWGVPANPVHNLQRGCENFNQLGCKRGTGQASGAEELPFLSMPSSCKSGPLTASAIADGWDLKVDKTTTVQLPAVDGCNQVQFEPTLQARPTTNLADSPSGLEFDLHVPRNEAPAGLATANLDKAVVTLPKGMAVNPSAASGLVGCSEAQADLKNEGPSNCPESSKLGTVEVDTELLDHPLPGAVYLARQNENPFGSVLGIYVAVDDPISGVIIKLAGKITPDPATGQLTASFEENPQQPFEDLKLNLFSGAQGALRTPATCGIYEPTSELTPWSAPESGPPATPTDSFEIRSGPNGLASCPHNPSEEENKPRFLAGTEAPQGGTYSPLTVRLVREDGSQEIKEVDTTLPAGLTGKLAGIPYCPQAQIEAARHTTGAAEQASPACPAGSEVGTVSVGAGAGPDPYYVSGHAYLAGTYQGAPLSLVIITPALAGPFDLGDVVVQAALHVNPETTQIQVTSGPIPTILDGIPLDLRSITLNANRPDFTLNPTSCNEMAFSGAETSVLDQVAPLSQRFQVANCASLPFAPKLAARVSGSTHHTGNPALKTELTFPQPGPSANVSRVSFTLPHAEFLDNAHIRAPCTRTQFSANQCPAGSLLGYAKAETPLLEKPLEGPVYLRANGGERRLPDLVVQLKGQIDINLVGFITSVHERLRTTFETVPDAPVSKFTLNLDGGSKGLLANSINLCSAIEHVNVQVDGQNGKAINQNPVLGTRCAKQKRKTHKKTGAHR